MAEEKDFKNIEAILRNYFEKEREVNLTRSMNSLDKRLNSKMKSEGLGSGEKRLLGLNLHMLGGVSVILLLGAIGVFGYTYIFSDVPSNNDIPLVEKRDSSNFGEAENPIEKRNGDVGIELVEIKPENRENIPLDTKFEFELSDDVENVDMNLIQKEFNFIPPIEGEFHRDGSKLVFIPNKLKSGTKYKLVLDSAVQYNGEKPVVFETAKE